MVEGVRTRRGRFTAAGADRGREMAAKLARLVARILDRPTSDRDDRRSRRRREGQPGREARPRDGCGNPNQRQQNAKGIAKPERGTNARSRTRSPFRSERWPHGRSPGRSRRADRIGDRCAGGAARPRRRSAQGGLRLDSAPNPWHNSRDWLGLSELETVTRAPDGTSGPSPPRLSPPRTLPERPAPRQRRGCGRCRSCGRQERAHRSLQNRADAVSHKRPQPHCCC